MSHEEIRRENIEKQFAALGFPRVRVSATHAKDGFARNLCEKNEVGEETFWTLQDIFKNMSKLAHLNAKNHNIFVTPIEDDQHIFVLVDDIRPSLADAGFSPNLIIQSSPASRQAVFVLPYTFPREAYLAAFNAINKEHGDPQISGLRHPFRLCSFTNRKEKYKDSRGLSPFVQIEKTMPTGHVCPVMLSFVEQLAAERQGPLPGSAAPATFRPSAHQPEDAAMGRDYYLARTLISGGKTGTTLRHEFEEKSEHLQDVKLGISGYDIDPERYINRTLENAETAVAKAKATRPAPRTCGLRPGFHKAPARPAATTGPKP